jgi:methyltransferase family protein
MPEAGAPAFDSTNDLTRDLMADIEREVRARRRAGQFDDDYERELDRIFDAVAPPGASGSGLEAALARAERAAVIDPVGPVASRIPGVALVRRVLRKALAFYVEHVARQVTAFGVMIVRSVRLLGERVDAIEARSPVTDPRVARVAVPVTSDLDLAAWHELALKRFAPVSGRVLHAECGDGALLVALCDAGIDAYGVDPRGDAAAVADEHDAEVRTVGALEHVRAVPAAALGGVVLSGCVERLAVGDLVELVERSATALAPGAPLLLTSRAAGDAHADPIAADLAPGRPLHPETWVFLLGRAGFEDVEAHVADAGGSYAVTATRATA